uniref:Uncharacterized protein n=1 Tax=Panagrolaimus davidi TaxID=227884 RepID=A0A914R915_9BILA
MKPILYLFISLCVLGSTFARTPLLKCSENEALASCPGCEPSCKNPNPICPMICREGQACQCSAGFVRNDAGKCVQQTECSTTGGNSTTQCKENETLKSCPGCEKTCANPNPVCTLQCREGQECECSEGFVRNDAGKCVKLAECPSNGTKQCKENETLKSCPGCEKTCANPNPVCTEICREGQECECSDGFVRNDAGKCVTEAQCNSSQNPSNSTTSCPKNEVYMECGGCEGSCTSHNPMCTMQCRPAGCYCPVGKGFVRGPKGHCIHKSVCQKRVKDSVMNNSGEEEYNPCAATSCPVNTTCELVKVQCIKAPCPPQVRCVPIDPSTINPCSSKICPENTECKLNQVQCIRAPCPPIPECVPVNETRPSRSTPILDKCAVVRCMAGTTCVDGKCVPNSQQNPCLTTLCPPNTVCKLNQVQCIRAPCPPIPECVPINETRPSRSTPILDKCAAILCTADSTCVDGKCVKIPQQNPCATMRCGPNTRCEKVQVMCKKAPCPPQGRCVPINETTEDPTVPLLTCETVDCIQGRVCRMLVTCLDQDKPCPPKPTCVPVPDEQQIDDPCALIDCRDGFKCITIRTNCVMAPCNVIPVEGKCVPMNETVEIDRPDRESPNNDDPCATIKCSAGSECMTIMPDCIEGATDCKPKGVCSPSPKPSSDLCATVKCAAGTKCDVMLPKCVAGAKDCGPKAVCLPVTRPSRETNPKNDRKLSIIEYLN